MKLSLPLCALLCLGLSLQGQKKAVPGQNSLSTEQVPAQGKEDEQTTKITLDVTRVNVLFTVTDKKGRFVTDLGRDDFSVAEGKKLQTIQEFNAESDLPLRLAVLVDTSNSIRTEFKFEQEAAVRFMQSVLRPRTDRISSSGSLRRSRPSNSTSPDTIRPGGLGIRRMIDSASTDLPEPDSPTIATVSPASTV